MEAATDAIIAKLASEQSISNEAFVMLHFLHQDNLARCLSILDRDGVRKIVAETSRRFTYVVHGEKKESEEHLCFPMHFCSCFSFFYEVIVRKHQPCCKHQLAARIAEALRVYKQETVSDEELAVLLLNKRSKHPKANVQLQYVLEDEKNQVSNAQAA